MRVASAWARVGDPLAGRSVSRGPTPENLARQDRVLAILRDNDGFPVSARDIASALNETKTWTHRCKCHLCGHQHTASREYPVRGDDLLPMLRRLDRKGLVERVSMPSARRAYWRAVTPTQVT